MSKFELYYPVSPAIINQPFGNVMAVYTAMGIKGHNGLDMIASHGQPIYAAHDGNAYWENDGSAGQGVVICSNDTFDYNGGQSKMKTIYWHMCDPIKEPKFKSPIYGDVIVPVKRGDLIGYADNTGISTGDHLHFGLKPGLPGEPDAQFINSEPSNGYNGAIDPTPYFNGKFAHELSAKPLTSIETAIFMLIKGLAKGSRGDTVKRLQMLLIDTGYPIPAGPTGFYGEQTLAAVKSWKLKHNVL
jgi:murein DD-endopeptidase MepM/ murein hydrolase activator NlpD